MGGCASVQTLPDKIMLTTGYCRKLTNKYNLQMQNEILLLIAKYVLFEELISHKHILSDEHIKILTKMDIICLRTIDNYYVGTVEEDKLQIFGPEIIEIKLKAYIKKKPKNESIIIGSLGIGWGFTRLLCYKMNKPENGKYFYNENSYYSFVIGGPGGSGYFAESSSQTFNNGDHLDNIQLGNIIDVAHEIWKCKQMLMGNIPFEDSDEEDDNL